MANKDYTALLLIIDRSGSMSNIQSAMVDGINGIKKDLLKEVAASGGKITVDVVQFDTEIEHVNKFTPLALYTPYLDPRGSTALYDGIVTGASNLRDAIELLDEDERPGHVQVVVVTDGQENASRLADAQLVSDTVTWCTDQLGWDFTFLGANQDAVYVGAALGFEGKKSMTFNSTAAGVAGTASSLSSYIASARRGEDAEYSDADRTAALGH